MRFYDCTQKLKMTTNGLKELNQERLSLIGQEAKNPGFQIGDYKGLYGKEEHLLITLKNATNLWDDELKKLLVLRFMEIMYRNRTELDITLQNIEYTNKLECS